MFTIGEFSRITGLTIKAIRLYHEKGILIPSSVDSESGYRYYSHSDIDKARAISYLREMTFSIAEIKEILEDYSDESEITEFLQRKKDVIQMKIRQLKNITVSLDHVIKNEIEVSEMLNQNEFEIVEKELEQPLVAGIKWKGKYTDTGKYLPRVYRAAGRHARGKPFNLYYDAEYKENDAEVESCVPIDKKIEAPGVTVRKLEGGHCATLIHKGPYERLGITYARIIDYTKKNKYKMLLPIREIYIKGPGMILKGNPKKYLTEIQIPVTPISEEEDE